MIVNVSGVCTLNNVRADFSLSSGKIHVIIGSNGSGKTTLLKSVVGLLPLREGKITINEHDFGQLGRRELSRCFAFVPQFFNVSLPLPVSEVVSMGEVNSVNPFSFTRDNEEKTKRILEECGISHLADRMINQLSGGELALVSLARALMQDSDFIMLDEVDAGLDLKRKDDYYGLILKTVSQKGKGVAVITHSPDFIFMLRDDDVVLAVTPEGIVERKYVKDVTEAFLSYVYGVPLSFIKSEAGTALAVNRQRRDCCC